MIENLKGIVVRKTEYQESSKILMVYTKKYGNISVIGKGARRQGSPLSASLEVFNYISFIIYHKFERDVQPVKESVIIESFENIKSSPELYKTGMAILYIIKHIGKTGEYFPLLLNSLRKLNEGNIDIFWRFYILSLSIAGYKPALDRCRHCKKEIKESGYFVISEGGVLCKDCYTDSGLYLEKNEIQRLKTLGKGKILKLNKKEKSLLLNFGRYHFGEWVSHIG